MVTFGSQATVFLETIFNDLFGNLARNGGILPGAPWQDYFAGQRARRPGLDAVAGSVHADIFCSPSPPKNFRPSTERQSHYTIAAIYHRCDSNTFRIARELAVARNAVYRELRKQEMPRRRCRLGIDRITDICERCENSQLYFPRLSDFLYVRRDANLP